MRRHFPTTTLKMTTTLVVRLFWLCLGMLGLICVQAADLVNSDYKEITVKWSWGLMGVLLTDSLTPDSSALILSKYICIP